MQRLCTRLRGLTLQSTQSQALSSSRRLLHSSTPIHQALYSASSTSSSWRFSSLFSYQSSSKTHLSLSAPSLYSSQLPLSFVQVRHVSSRERKKRRKPTTPVTSKVKKIKMKSYSSYKYRFRTMNDGKIRCWHEGKNHNAHSKSKKAKRRLRQPALVPAAYAKVMKKLNFCG
ncbi:50S ribosomal protein L35 [Melia azedarach]|uniref:50S ribosomal protein L35 n=1 Tax=Melia azedarach TaxID=155640 RepID=A0ACC1YXL2_MELAZ|nr:50S ribosomal protein L35 [Melia azedarach]